ncbi:MAG: hypothetical protein ABI895_29960 [Deltaproteobacteria bacterium]
MRYNLARAYAFVHARAKQLAAGAFYTIAAAVTVWGLLVMLRGQLPDHADGLWVVSFAHDVLHGIPLRGWRLPGAPVYFPELFSVLVSSGLGFGTRSSLLIHAVCSWLLLAGGIYWGLRLGGVGVARALRIGFAVLLVYVLLHSGSSLLQPFEYPFSHGGVVLVGFFGLLYIAHGLERGFELRAWLVAVFFLGLSCASDRAILAQFVAPALLVVMMFLALSAGLRHRLFWALGLLMLAPLLGQLTTVLIRWSIGVSPGGYHSRYGWVRSARTLLRVYDDLQHLALDRPLLAASVLLPVLFLSWRALAAVCAGVRSRRAGASNGGSVTAESWLSCAGIAVLVSTLGAVVAANVWDGPASFRYLLPVFLLPLALGVIVAGPSHLRLGSGWARLFELTLLFLLVLVATRTERRIPRRLATLDSPSRACLDSYLTEAGLYAGYAEYWSARPTMLLGQAGVTLAQVTGRLAPKWWADNRFWYTRGFSSGRDRPRFSFVITQRLDVRWLGERFGPPRVEHHCFGFEVWVYDRPEDLEFRNYLRSGVARATTATGGWWSVHRRTMQRNWRQSS